MTKVIRMVYQNAQNLGTTILGKVGKKVYSGYINWVGYKKANTYFSPFWGLRCPRSRFWEIH